MSDRTTVIICGKGELACNILGWLMNHKNRYDVICVLPVTPEPTWTSSLMSATRYRGLTVLHGGNFRAIRKTYPTTKIDLVISAFYDKIFDDNFIKSVGRVINCHASPLPIGRGMNPINWALKEGRTEHGFTIHEVDAGIDTGPIISQVKFTISPDEEVKDVYERTLRFGFQLFKETMPLLDRFTPQSQNSDGATYHSKKDAAFLAERSSWTREGWVK